MIKNYFRDAKNNNNILQCVNGMGIAFEFSYLRIYSILHRLDIFYLTILKESMV